MADKRSIEAERHLLGAMLLDGACIADVADVVRPEHFSDTRLAESYAAALAINAKGEPLDAVTLAERMGGEHEHAKLAIELTDAAATAVNATHHAKIVRALAGLRRLSSACKRVANMADSASVDEGPAVHEEAAGILYDLDEREGGTTRPLPEDMIAVIEAAQLAFESKGDEIRGTSTGLAALDQYFRYRDGHVYVMASTSGHGKTAWGVWSGWQAARSSGKTTLYVSVEIDGFDVALRILSSSSHVSGTRIEGGDLTGGDIERILRANQTTIKEHGPRFWTAFRPGATETFVRQAVQRMQRSGHTLGLVVVDYVQRIRSSRRQRNREQEVADISGALLEVAQSARVPVLLLAQLNRDLFKRSNPVPVISDLRESSAIEHDASVVVMLHRPQMHGLDAPENLAEFHIRKNRKGRLGKVDASFDAALGAFSDRALQGGRL